MALAVPFWNPLKSVTAQALERIPGSFGSGVAANIRDPNRAFWQGPTAAAQGGGAPAIPGMDDPTSTYVPPSPTSMASSVYVPPAPLRYDVLGKMNAATQQATADVQPLYQQKINQLLTKMNLKRETAKGGFDRTKTALEASLQDTLTGTGIERGRTQEDVTERLGDIDSQETTFRDVEGAQFDEDRRQLAVDVAAAGLGTSGIGKGKVRRAQEVRDIASTQQTQKFEKERRAVNKFLSRTFEDLNREDQVQRRKTGEEIDIKKFDMDQALKMVDVEQDIEQIQTDVWRGEAIRSKSDDIYRTDLNKWIEDIRDNPALYAATRGAYRS